MKLLLVEDSERLQRSLSTGLKKHGFTLDQAFDGEQALAYIAVNQYDAIILDLMLPKIDGLTVLSKLRRDGRDCHVLILSANDQTEDRVRGLDLGADDYLVKPFAFDELVSRLHALDRRRSGVKNPVIEIDGLKIDSVARLVLFEDEAITLTPHEYRLLEFLARRRGRVFSHDQLIDQLYDAGSYVTRNAVEAHISSLRKRLSNAGAPKLIQTRRGFGYLVG
ncbi:MAG: response regulator transcription factor [Gammaproteobacteria bacterium]|nr:response regulator transcription factor [Gammaproteobacteria bacterium]